MINSLLWAGPNIFITSKTGVNSCDLQYSLSRFEDMLNSLASSFGLIAKFILGVIFISVTHEILKDFLLFTALQYGFVRNDVQV